MTVDRLAPGYEPNFDIDFAVGQQGELFMTHVLRSLGTERIEVKTDQMAGQTGNVYIEYECRGRQSGIATTKAEFWAWVLPGDVLVVARVALVREVARAYFRAGRTHCPRGSHPTKGVLVPVGRLVAALKDAAINTPF
jgi:hypothetical protein